ncbi:MAG: hypothetical protein ABIQ95_02735 [Bdellovibrionia bacterium]
MTIVWRLKTYLAAQHGVHTAVALQKLIVRKTGVLVSAQNIRNYLGKKPKILPLKTMELIVTALGCELHDFCRVTASKTIQADGEVKKHSYQNTPTSKRAGKNFPNPSDYS